MWGSIVALHGSYPHELAHPAYRWRDAQHHQVASGRSELPGGCEEVAPGPGAQRVACGEKRKEYWLLFPPDGSTAPARMPGTPSSQRTWSNLLADLKRKGYKP